MCLGGQWRPVAVMMAINFAFAVVNVLLKKVIDGGTNHMVVVTYRLSISFIFLSPIAYYMEWKTRPKLTACILWQLFFGALIGLTLTQYVFLLGLGYTSAAFSCAFLNMVPVSTFIISLPFGLEKVNIRNQAGKSKVLGALICMAGAILLPIYKGFPLTHDHSQVTKTDTTSHVDTERTQRWVIGSIFLMAGCLLWSSWFPIQAKVSERFPAKYTSTALYTFFGAVQSAVLCCILDRDGSIWILKGKVEIISIAYSGVVGSGLCYVVLTWCVKQKGPVFTAAFTPFVQIFAAMFDFSILHEQMYFGSVLGSVLVITGLYILLWGKSMEADEYSTKEAQLTKGTDENFDPELQVPVTINSASK